MVININFIYSLAILLIFITDSVFIAFIYNKEDGPDNSIMNLVTAISVLGAIASFIVIPKRMKIWLGVLCGYFFFLMLESYYWYGTPFKYPHVFSKVTAMFTFFFIYGFYYKFKRINIPFLIGILLIAVVLNLAFINSAALSLSSFANHERGIQASTAYILLFPGLYFFNMYFFKKKQYYLWLFLIMMGLIVFFQHRTVWVASAFALMVNTLLLLFKSRVGIRLGTLLPLIGYPLMAGFILLTFVIANKPEIIEKIVTDIEDIQNYDKQGTGAWRQEQFRSYAPFIKDNIFTGMRFRGFELPVQFYREQDGGVVFSDGTGHHFHSNYVDLLFYFGMVGVMLFYVPAFLLVLKKIRRVRYLTIEQILFVSFMATGLSYSYSYLLPLFYYGIAGIGFYFLDTQSNLSQNLLLDE